MGDSAHVSGTGSRIVNSRKAAKAIKVFFPIGLSLWNHIFGMVKLPIHRTGLYGNKDNTRGHSKVSTYPPRPGRVGSGEPKKHLFFLGFLYKFCFGGCNDL